MLNPKANVIVGVTGLAICHFKRGAEPKYDKWEFLFPREVPDHPLRIKILTRFKSGATSNWELMVPDTVKRIAMNSTEVIELLREERFTYPGGMEKNQLDSRWILDLSGGDLYGTRVQLRNKQNKKFTYLSIPRGTLYTLEHPEKDLAWHIKKGDALYKTRKVAKTAGIDIEWRDDKGATEISDVTNPKNSISLTPDIDIKYSPNVALYEVTFDNDCKICNDCSVSDFKYYNEQLIDMADVFQVEAPPVFGGDPPDK